MLGDLDQAYQKAAQTHEQWIKLWGSEELYIQAHGAWGTELPSAFNLQRTMISVTTDPKVAEYFAAGGTVFFGQLPRSQLLPQTLEGAAESEFLIRIGVWEFMPVQ